MWCMSHGRTYSYYAEHDVNRNGDLFLVTLGKTKTKVSGSFTINGSFAAIVQKYIDLRPTRVDAKDRFFMNYQCGRCTKFGSMPRRMAEYLCLPNLERYTGTSNIYTFRWLHVFTFCIFDFRSCFSTRFRYHISKQRC